MEYRFLIFILVTFGREIFSIPLKYFACLRVKDKVNVHKFQLLTLITVQLSWFFIHFQS